MIPEFIKRRFKLRYQYSDVLQQQRAQRLLYIIGFLFFTTGIWTVLISIPGMGAGSFTLVEIVAPIIFVANVMLYLLVQSGELVWSARIFVALIFMTTVFPQIVDPSLSQTGAIVMPIVIAGILLSPIESVILTFAVVIILIRGAFVNGITESTFGNAIGVALSVFMSGVFLAIYNSTVETVIKTANDLISKTQQLGQRQHLSDTSPSTETIISNAINHLRQDLGFSYIRVVLLDDSQQPISVFYSSIGVERIAQSTGFNFTATSAFQKALDDRHSTIITQSDAGNLSAHLLPASSSGIMIPAYNFGQVIALFDIQTESEAGITEEVSTVLELYVENIAGELVYQRIVNALRNDIQEQQAIINQQRIQIDNLQINQTEGIISDWQYYLEQRGLHAIGYDINDKRQVSNLAAGDIPAELRSAFENGEVTITSQGDEQHVVIPIQFRETVVGAISFIIPKEISITERKLDFIRSVTERLALALDNKRLLEQTRIQAQRESTANEIGSMLLSSTDVQSVLSTAVDRFNEALGAVSTRIYLQPTSLQSAENVQREDAI